MDAPPLPVIAEVIGSTEHFAGEIDGSDLKISSNRGTLCRGRIDMGYLGFGSANLRCSDGRFGSFVVDIKGRFGSAYGRLGAADVKITIG